VLGFKKGPALGYVCEAGWVVKTEIQSWAGALIGTICALSIALMIVIYGYHFWYQHKSMEKYTGI
jgi:hypothetical protein